MRVLGIDPGSRLCGYGIVEERASRYHHIDCGVIVLDPKQSLAQRLLILHQRMLEIVTKYEPEAVSVEEAFFAKNAQSALKLGSARGVALMTAALCGLPVGEYATKQIKKSVVGTGRADKRQVQEMVKLILGLPEVPQVDAADALAAAICHLQAGTLRKMQGTGV